MTRIIDNQKVFRRLRAREHKTQIKARINRLRGIFYDRKIALSYMLSAGKINKRGVSLVLILLAFSGFVVFSSVASSGISYHQLTFHNDEQVYNDLLHFLEPFIPSMGSGEYPLHEQFVLPFPSESVYQIQKGDTLSGIAARHNVSVSTLVSYNNIVNVRRLIPGTPIKIPSIDGINHKVARGENIHSLSTRYSVSVNKILDANDLTTDVLQIGQELFIPGARMNPYELAKAKGELFTWPTRGRLTSGYGYRNDPFTGVRRFHYGIDIANATGTRINAAMAGRVVLAQRGNTGYGNYVVIRHSYGGYQTLYGHLHTISVRQNQWVEQGQIIGTMGSTGRSTGPHLHFSVYQNNRPVNPSTLLH